MAVLRVTQDGTAAVDEQLVVDASAALRRGALVAMLLAVVGLIGIPILSLRGAAGLWLPWMFCWLCLGACGALYVAARRQLIRGPGAYAVMLPWVSLPTLFFVRALDAPRREPAGRTHPLRRERQRSSQVRARRAAQQGARG